MKLIAVTTGSFFEGEAAAVNCLLGEGADLLHLRKPFSEKQQMRELLRGIRTEHYGRIVLHDHFDLLDDFPLKGVHLNRRNPVSPQREHLSVSRSCHSLRELESFADDYDYLLLSPVFDSISKPGYHAAYSADALQAAGSEKLINKKTIALGGVNERNIPLLARYGFGGAAVVGALWGDYEIDGNLPALSERLAALLRQLT